ncbi:MULTISPECIES: hypothetical protein [unclassified Microbulbifer]|uniref:hypothetical protein n=1 Tax=unclassified Microbulbifer TaxID=2619833 RepID=UPI0027E5962F|nr:MULTISPECIES: hypothetical protein [unclassified Microbulbifer]
MRSHDFSLDATNVNVIWRALCDREEKLLDIIKNGDEESDEVVFASNDVVYLRGFKRWIKEEALKAFDESVLSTSDDVIEP